MKANYFLWLLLITLAFSTPSKGQDSGPQNLRSRKEQETYDIQQEKFKKAEEKGIKQHEKIQKKKTRKRMKRDKKKARAFNDPKKQFVLFKWFGIK